MTGAQTTLHGVTGLSRVDGGGYPARIWADYTGRALRDSPPTGFDLSPVPAPAPRADAPGYGEPPGTQPWSPRWRTG